MTPGALIHIAEVAALLLVAYTLGWGVGYLLRRATARPATEANAIPAERIAAAVGEAAAVPAVAAAAPPAMPPMVPIPPVSLPPPVAVEPVIVAAPLAPIAEPVAPVAAQPPAPVPAAAVPAAQPAPAPVAALPEPPVIAPAARPAPVPVPAVAAASLFPASPPKPSSLPGLAWSGDLAGRRASRYDPAAEPAARSVAATSVEDAPRATAPEAVIVAAPAAEPVVVPELKVEPAPPVIEAIPEPVPEPAATEADEHAAMRAIEGGWSRRDVRALKDQPEMIDVSSAVAAAQNAVQQVLASAGVEPAGHGFGKPTGLPRPRSGGKDNLKQIDGLGQLDETTLNNLGIYHFEQVAAWSETEVLWLENHAFAVGRIGRENWQGHARDLVARRSAASRLARL